MKQGSKCTQQTYLAEGLDCSRLCHQHRLGNMAPNRDKEVVDRYCTLGTDHDGDDLAYDDDHDDIAHPVRVSRRKVKVVSGSFR